MERSTEGLSQIEYVIVELNRIKRAKPGNNWDLLRDLNDLQRRLEIEAGVTAVELDPAYNND